MLKPGLPRFLSKNECKALLDHSDDHLYPVFYTFLNTGLRLGELTNLQWKDIDFGRKVLHVRKKAEWQPKAGAREVPLSDGMVKLLQEHKPARVGMNRNVFTARNGTKLNERMLRKWLTKTAKAAGIDDLTKIHTLRHTFASHLVMSGVDLPTVQKLLGHADIQTTMIYAHLAKDHLAEAVNKLEFE